MIRSLYTSGWTMQANEKKLDVITNNIANANTNGYKKDTVVMQTFPEVLANRIHDSKSKSSPSGKVGSMELGSDVGEVFTYYTQGQLMQTEKKSDLAIADSNRGFFTIEKQGSDGNKKNVYTKDGSFVINENGQLATKDGGIVLGASGPINLSGEDFNVSLDGQVSQNGNIIDNLLLTEFTDDTVLEKIGNSYVIPQAGGQTQGAPQTKPFEGKVQQGFSEQSNVDVVREMVDMITVIRSYEANQKVIQSIDQTLGKAVNEVGSIR